MKSLRSSLFPKMASREKDAELLPVHDTTHREAGVGDCDLSAERLSALLQMQGLLGNEKMSSNSCSWGLALAWASFPSSNYPSWQRFLTTAPTRNQSFFSLNGSWTPQYLDASTQPPSEERLGELTAESNSLGSQLF